MKAQKRPEKLSEFNVGSAMARRKSAARLSASRVERKKLLLRARAAFWGNKYGTALRLMETYTEKWPEDLVAAIKLLNIVDFVGTTSTPRREGRRFHRRAEKGYRALLANHPENPTLWIDLGDCLVNLDEPRRALLCYSAALRHLRNGKHFRSQSEEFEEALEGHRFARSLLPRKKKKRPARSSRAIR